MQIRFTHIAEIRSSSTDLTDLTLIGQIFEHAVIDVEDMMYPGAVIGGNDHWYRGANGWFFWSGFAIPVLPELTGAEAVQNNGILPELPSTVLVQEMPDLVAVLQESDEAVFDETGELTPFGETRLPFDLVADELMMGIIDLPEDQLLERRMLTRPQSLPADQSGIMYPNELLNWGIRLLDIQQQYWIEKQATGKGVRIALLGTGVATNCEDIEIADAFVFPGLNDDITDLDGVGTQAAIAATGRGISRYGVAPQSILLVGKIGAFHYTITSQGLIDALDWAIDAEADIIVVLTRLPGLDPATEQLIKQKIDAAVSANIIVVAPAGHVSDHYPEAQYPSAFPGVLSVGSCNELGNRSSFSAKIGKIDLLAPGEGLEVVSYDGESTVLNTPDTAIAAAFTAGCIALMIQDCRNKNITYSAVQMVDRLKMMAFNKQKYGVHERDAGTGYGLLRLPE
jgi:subtilisin family serine protease